MDLPTGDQLGSFKLMLGDELRQARNALGWTRKQMLDQMYPDDDDEAVSLQTLATYELGTRRMSVDRLVAMCAALRQQPDELLLRAITRTFGTGRRIVIDLAALARTTDPRLQHLQRWATVRAQQRPQGKAPIESLDYDALTALANVAGTTEYQLLQALRDLNGATTS